MQAPAQAPLELPPWPGWKRVASMLLLRCYTFCEAPTYDGTCRDGRLPGGEASCSHAHWLIPCCPLSPTNLAEATERVGAV